MHLRDFQPPNPNATSIYPTKCLKSFALVVVMFVSAFAARGQSPLAAWNLDEGSGNTTTDSSGNGYLGVLTGAVLPSWVASPIGGTALQLDGANGYVTITNFPGNWSSGLTLAGWVNVKSFANNGRIVARDSSPSRAWGLGVESSADWNFSVASSASVRKNFLTPINGMTNRWVHVAGVYDPAIHDMKIYINGLLISQVNDGTVPLAAFDTTANVYIGRRGTTEVMNGQLDGVRVFTNVLTAQQISNLVSPQALSFLQQPVSQTILVPNSAMFTLNFSGLPGFIRWYTNGVAVPGVAGSLTNYTIPSVQSAMNGMTVSVIVSNLASTIISSNAILTATTDATPPTLISAGSADGLTIGLRFSEALDPPTATTLGNYSINGGAFNVTSATLWDSQTVALQVDTQITGGFTAQVSNVKDASGNTITPASSASGTPDGLTVTDLGSPLTAGGLLSYTNAQYAMRAGGSGMGGLLAGTGTSDSGLVAMKPVSGDFDVQLQEITITGGLKSFAGLMIRASMDANSAMIGMMPGAPAASGGDGWFYTSRRASTGAGAFASNPAVLGLVEPIVWVRLRRFGDQVSTYSSSNSVDWVLRTTFPFSAVDPVYLGVAATAGTNGTGVFMSGLVQRFGGVTFPGATLVVDQQPTNQTATANSVITINASFIAAGGPISETVLYQWQRYDGISLFTNIPGATTASYSLTANVSDSGSQFRLKAAYAGLFTNTVAATLTVQPDVAPPTITRVLARTDASQIVVTFSEAVDASSAGNTANYTVSGGRTVNSAVLGTDNRTATLTVDIPMVDGAGYTLSVSSVQDIASPPNTIVSPTTMGFTYSTFFGWWKFDESSGLSAADQAGGGLTATLIDGTSWTAGVGNSGLQFDGSNDGVCISNTAGVHINGAMTLAAWVWPNSTNTPGRIVAKSGGAAPLRGWGLNVETANGWFWSLQVALDNATTVALLATNPPLQTWTHVVGVLDPADPGGPAMKLYTNGVLAAQRNDFVPPVQFDPALDIFIGRRSAGSFFDGKLDDVRIYSRALSDTEIAVIAALPSPQFSTSTISGGQINLNWSGIGELQWAPTVTGPWTPISPRPNPPYSEAVTPGVNRFFRLRAAP